MSGTLLLLLVLASYRATRLVTTDTLTEPVRERVFNRWPPNDRRAGQRYIPDRDLMVSRSASAPGPDPHWFGRLIECPWCTGAWLSAAVVATTDAIVGLALPVLVWAAVCAGVGLVAELEGKLSA